MPLRPAKLKMRGKLGIRVIRATPSKRQRFADWLARVIRRVKRESF